MKKLLTFLLLLLVFPAALQAQEGETTAEAANQLDIFADFYNHDSGWHVLKPRGWADESTADYARFTDGTNTIFAIGYPGGDASSTAAALQTAEITVSGEPADIREVNLVNGTWTQQYYPGTPGVLVHTQQYDGVQYVLIFTGAAIAQPLIIAHEGAAEDPALAAEAIAEAVRVLYPAAGEPVSTETQGTDTLQPVTIQEYQVEGETVNVIGRARGGTVYTVVGTGDIATLNEASVYFTVLNDFFITPNTAPYLWLGVGLTFGILLILIGSLFLRYRSLLKDEATLRELETT